MNLYYIYALKDPRLTPPSPFYIGKGTGARAWDHTMRVDSTRKGRRIEEIISEGHEVITSILVDNLDEYQAIKLEAQLISTFGTEDSGGPLTNSIIPSGTAGETNQEIITPSGVVEKAQIGLELLKSAVFELAQANPDGIRNADAVNTLGLQTDFNGGANNYLTYSILGVLIREGKITYTGARNTRRFFVSTRQL